MEHIFSSYQSTLDSLVFDTVIELNNKPLDMETKANLELWVCNFYLIQKKKKINLLVFSDL
jgi:hypothetical protein